MFKPHNIADTRIVDILLDDNYWKIIEFMREFQQPFKSSLLQKELEKSGFVRRLSSIIEMLKELEKVGFVKQDLHGKGEHKVWEPLSSEYYQKLTQFREELKNTIRKIKSETEIVSVLPVAKRISMDLKTEERQDRFKKLQERLSGIVDILLKNFQYLDPREKKNVFDWAFQSDYFKKKSYS